MRTETLRIEIQRFRLNELSQGELQLIHLARNATHQSYSPYSKFRVGAVAQAEDGTLCAGANVENASYGLTVCAERTAIFKAWQQGMKDIRTIAVTGRIGKIPELEYHGTPVTPCGACRQVIREAEDRARQPITILMDGYGDEVIKVVGIGALLPLGFGPSDFGVEVDE